MKKTLVGAFNVNRLVLAVSLSLSFQSHAEFKSSKYVDEMEDVAYFSSTTDSIRGTGGRFGFKCRISEYKNDFFIHYESDAVLATPRSEVDIKYRIDKKDINYVRGVNYSNSYRSGLIDGDEFGELFYEELPQGEYLLAEIYSLGELKAKDKFSLNGVADALKSIQNKCRDNNRVFPPGYEDELKKLKDKHFQEWAQLQTTQVTEVVELKKRYGVFGKWKNQH